MYLDHAGTHIPSLVPVERDPAAAEVVRHLRDLADRLESTGAVDDRTQPVQHPAQKPERKDYLLKVRAIRAERSARRQIFGDTLVEDPAWAIMLELFEAHHAQRACCIKSACLASEVPATTALRYLSMMESIGVVERRPDQCDRRRILLGLTDKGLRKLHRYFDEL